MLHEIALSCTCRVDDVYAGIKGDGEERRREPYCDRCGGDGWLFRDPDQIVGLATSIRQQRNVLDAGIAQPGDMTFSPMPEEVTCESTGRRRVTQYDKLTALWDQPLDDGQVIVRGAGTSHENKSLVTHLSESEDRLWYEPSSSIWCEDDEGTTYTENGDFELGPGRIIKWVGNQPRVGQRYSFKYNAFFEWIVYAPPTERVDRDNNDLGSLVMLRRRHIAIVNSSPLTTAADHVSLQSRLSC